MIACCVLHQPKNYYDKWYESFFIPDPFHFALTPNGLERTYSNYPRTECSFFVASQVECIKFNSKLVIKISQAGPDQSQLIPQLLRTNKLERVDVNRKAFGNNRCWGKSIVKTFLVMRRMMYQLSAPGYWTQEIVVDQRMPMFLLLSRRNKIHPRKTWSQDSPKPSVVQVKYFASESQRTSDWAKV